MSTDNCTFYVCEKKIFTVCPLKFFFLNFLNLNGFVAMISFVLFNLSFCTNKVER